MYHYQKEGDQYQLVRTEDGKLISTMTHVAIVYRGRGVEAFMIKHGDAERVQRYYDKNVAALTRDGMMEEALDMKMIVSDKFDCKDLNRCLETTGYIEYPLRG